MNRRHFNTCLGAAVLTGLAPTRAAATQRVDEDDLDVPYVQTPPAMVERMMEIAEVGPSDYLIDLGSGDGRIAIAAARRGARALGVDIDPDRVNEAAMKAQMADLQNLVRFRRQDLFRTPLREASVVAMYLLPRINLQLRPRLLTELRPGTRVVSHAFHMGDWRPDVHEQVDGRNLYLWIVPAIAGGPWLLTLANGQSHAIEIDQRYQDATGTADGQALADVSLRGARFRFRMGERRFAGLVGDADIRPDPDGGAGLETGWRAGRAA